MCVQVERASEVAGIVQGVSVCVSVRMHACVCVYGLRM